MERVALMVPHSVNMSLEILKVSQLALMLVSLKEGGLASGTEM